MSAKYWQRGETIDYTPTDDLANGDVVDLATRIGVAGNDIPAGETGAVHVVGVFEIPKAHRRRHGGPGPLLGQGGGKHHHRSGQQPGEHPGRLGRGGGRVQ